MHFINQTELFNMHEKNNFDEARDMNAYPSLLTPPSESPETIQVLSPPSGQNLYMPVQGYMPKYEMNHRQGFMPGNPYLKILEQPVDRFRFRYKSEMAGTHGSLTGRAGDRNRKQTYPTIQLCNYNKPAIVRCSVYQHSGNEFADSQPHAHRLVRKAGSMEADDPHDLKVSAENDYIAGFHSMGIIHTARKNIISELTRKKALLKKEDISRAEGRKRELTGEEFVEIQNDAEDESKKINLNIVRLRFDAFEERNGILYPICPPVYSNSINNLKSALTGDLKIVRMDHCTSPSIGNREIFILVEKVTKKNIKIRFYEVEDEEIVWEDYGKFTDLDVHHQYAIVFRTPPYRDPNIDRHVKVFMELVRPSDGARSEPKDFTYTPCDIITGRKRPRTSYGSGSSYGSCGSNDIPLTIASYGETDNVIRSKDLEDALKMNQIDSDEIQKLFLEFGEDYSKNLDFENIDDLDHLTSDTPVHESDSSSKKKISKLENRSIYKQGFLESSDCADSRPLTFEEKKILYKFYNQLTSFLKTKPSLDRKREMAAFLFKKNFRTENEDTALHLALYGHIRKVLTVLMPLLYEVSNTDIINIRNNNKDTPLHVAVQTGVVTVVGFLISLKADMSAQNSKGDTPLHLVVRKQTSDPLKKQINLHILNYLLKNEKELKKFIDLENYSGDTALTIAIDTNNFEAVKMLCWRGADVNKQHNKSGFTALHMAINKQNLDIVNFLLDSNSMLLQKSDFKECTPYRLAVSLRDSGSAGRKICERIEEYMRTNGLSEIVEIKEENPEELSDDEEIKLEPMSPTKSDIDNEYSTPANFTPECLEEVASILDKSRNWEHLADLLDLSCFSRIDEISNYKSPSKSLLTLAIANGESIVRIRDFLENLDEMKAVEAIDRMIKKENEDM